MQYSQRNRRRLTKTTPPMLAEAGAATPSKPTAKPSKPVAAKPVAAKPGVAPPVAPSKLAHGTVSQPIVEKPIEIVPESSASMPRAHYTRTSRAIVRKR